MTHTYLVGLFWTRDRPAAGASTWKKIYNPHWDKYPWRRRDSNPQFQQASGRRHTSTRSPFLPCTSRRAHPGRWSTL